MLPGIGCMNKEPNSSLSLLKDILLDQRNLKIKLQKKSHQIHWIVSTIILKELNKKLKKGIK